VSATTVLCVIAPAVAVMVTFGWPVGVPVAVGVVGVVMGAVEEEQPAMIPMDKRAKADRARESAHLFAMVLR